MTDKATPPRIVAIDGPDQVVFGTEVELRWKLAGGPATQVLVNRDPVTGESYKACITADPTCFTVTVSNDAGSATSTKWVGAHAPGECVSSFVDLYSVEDVQLVLLDHAGKPVANEPCVVIQPDGERIEISTDASGAVLLAEVRAGARNISFPAREEISLDGAGAPSVLDGGRWFEGVVANGKSIFRLAAPKVAAPVAPKVAAPPAPAQPASDVIPAGSVIAPPKKSDYVADMDAEKKWFARLQELKSASLLPGDLLFYKFYDDSNLIVRGQSIFTGASKGSKYSIHCQVNLGGGKVLSAEAQGLIANDVWPDCIVYRPTDKSRAASATEVAKFLVSKNIPYSTFHIFEEPIHDRSYGPVARGRAEQIHRREVPVNAMMCSESVTYCFQDDFADPWIPLDASRVGPIHVEDYVNSHPERFTFVGKILDGKGGASSSASEVTQALNAIKVEAKADAKADAKAVEKAATQVATAAKADVKQVEKAATNVATAAKADVKQVEKAATTEAKKIGSKLKHLL